MNYYNQYWTLKRASEPHIIATGSFGEIYDKMAELEGLPKTNTAGLDTYKYTYDAIWSTEEYTQSSLLSERIMDAISDAMEQHEPSTRYDHLTKIADANTPIYTWDIATILEQDTALMLETPEYPNGKTIEQIAQALLFERIHSALYDFIETVAPLIERKEHEAAPIDPQEQFICEGCQ